MSLVVCTGVMIWRFEIHRRPSVVGATFLGLLVMYGVGAIPYSLEWVGGDILSRGAPHPQLPWFLVASFVFFTLGAVFAAWGLRFDLVKLHLRRMARPPVSRRLNQTLFYVLALGSCVGAVAYAFGAGRTGAEVLLASGEDTASLRSFRQSFATDNPYGYVGALINNVVGPLSLLIALNRAKLRRNAANIALAGALMVCLLLSSLASLQKAPIALLLLVVVLNFYWIQRGESRVRIRIWLAAAGVVVLVGLVGYMVTYHLSVSEAASWTRDRILVIPVAGVDAFLWVYPDKVEFNGGMGIGMLARLAGETDYISPPLLVGAIMAREGTSLNAFWSTELWAAFGYPGVIFGSFIVGAAMITIDRWALSFRRSELAAAQYAVLMVIAIKMLSTSFFTALLSGGLILTPMIAAALIMRYGTGPVAQDRR